MNTSSRISTEYIVHVRFSTEMTKNTNAHTQTQRHYHDPLSADENKSSTARTSIHPRKKDTDNFQLTSQRTCTHIRSARATLEWRVSSFLLRTAPALTCVESLIKKTNIRAHVYCEKNMSNGRRCLVMCTSKGNFDGNSQRSRLQIPICSCDWTGWWKCVCHNVDVWTRKILNCTSDGSCTEKLQWNTVPNHDRQRVLCENLYSIRNLTGNDDIKKNISGYSQRDTQVSTWCLLTITTDIHELTTHAVSTFATSASELQTSYISWNWSVYEWRL